jgi:predicted double-glycine peptidase
MPEMSVLRHIALAALLAFSSSALAPQAKAGAIAIESADTPFNIPVTTYKEMHFRRVVRQAYDFSCGSAALATLLTYHYGRRMAEDVVLKAMFEVGDQEKIKKEGFSLLDMKKYLESIGLRAEGYKVDLDKVAEVGIPGIVLIKTKGYLHFVVLKGIRGDDVLIGDPAQGAKFMSREKFKEIWSNDIFFVIVGNTREAKKEFNRTEDWSTIARSPLANAVARQSLQNLMLTLPSRNSF